MNQITRIAFALVTVACLSATQCGIIGDAAFNAVGPPRTCVVSVTLFRCDPAAPMGYGIAIWFSSEDVIATSGVSACDMTVPKVIQEHAVLDPDETVGFTVCTADCGAVPGASGILASNQMGSEGIPSGACGPGLCPAGPDGCGGTGGAGDGIGGSFGDGVGGSSDIGGVGAGPGSSVESSSADVGVGAGDAFNHGHGGIGGAQ